MARCRFVQPEIVRVPLSDGDFVDIKKELTAGEERHVFTDLIKTMRAGENAELDPARIGITRVLAYALAWSFVDSNGQPVPLSEAAINNLDKATFAELTKAIDDHDAAVEKARAERKNVQGGESTSSPISPSVAI